MLQSVIKTQDCTIFVHHNSICPGIWTVAPLERLWSGLHRFGERKALVTNVLACISVGFKTSHCKVRFSQCIQRHHSQQVDFQIPLTFLFFLSQLCCTQDCYTTDHRRLEVYMLANSSLATIDFKWLECLDCVVLIWL